MGDATTNAWQVGIAAAQFTALLLGAGWAYFRFWRQRTHWPALDLDAECRIFNAVNDARIVELSVSLENKGQVEHRFTRISLRLRGIVCGASLVIMPPAKDVLKFPVELVAIDNLLQRDDNYYFVRPKVKVRITRPFVIPANIQFLHLYAEFEYEQKGYFHSAQRVFEVPATALQDIASR